MSRPKVCIVIPAFNEELTVGKVIDEVPRHRLEKAGYDVDVLVVESRCTDSTRLIAERSGAHVLTEPIGGKGRAFRMALDATDADFVFMLDADHTYPAHHIPELLECLSSSHAVIGSRLKGSRDIGSMSRLNLVGNRLLSLLASVLCFKKVSDVCTGYWGFRREVVKSLGLMANEFDLEVELFTRLARMGYRIAEVPIQYRCRETPSKLGSFRDGLKIGWAMIRMRFGGLGNHLRVGTSDAT